VAIFALTGATGFIGQRLTDALIKKGHAIQILVRQPGLHSKPGQQLIVGTLEDKTSLERLIHGADAVVHLAGAVAGLGRSDFFKTNAAGTTHLVEAMERVQPDTPLLAISSLAARHPHLSDYAASKRAGETIVEGSGLAWAIIRPPAVFGPGDTAMLPLWQMMRRGLLPQLGPDNARFSLIHVDDLCDAIVATIQHPIVKSRRCFEIDDRFIGQEGPGYGWNDLALIAGEGYQRRIRPIRVPTWSLMAAAQLSQLSGRALGRARVFAPGKARELVHGQWVANSEPIWSELGLSPYRQLRDTLSALI